MRLSLLIACSLCIAGCGAILDFDDFSVGGSEGGVDGNGRDGGPTDGDAGDGAVASDGCVDGGTEICNDLDDDCDGRVDEDVDVDTPQNCGACGIDCGAGDCVMSETEHVCANAVQQLSSFGDFTCARSFAGEVSCWGANEEGQLGRGTTSTEASPSPVVISGLEADSIAAGQQHACAVVANDTLCWGFNDRAQLATDDRTRRTMPTATVMGSGVFGVYAGASHTCVRTMAQKLRCAGDNVYDQLGHSATDEYISAFVSAEALMDVRQVALGAAHSCTLDGEGVIHCWGDNSTGQLGNPAITVATVIPQPVTVPAGFVHLAAGDYHTCAIDRNGEVWCWGDNGRDQAQPEDGPAEVPEPQRVDLTRNASALAAGEAHTCAVMVDGSVECWGDDSSGQLGNGEEPGPGPVRVDGIGNARTIEAGRAHTCVALRTPAIRCWGANNQGQLGTGSGGPSRSVAQATLYP